MKETIRQYSLIKLEPGYKKWLQENDKNSILLNEEVFIYFSEIPNMPEHCVISGKKTGKVFGGFHLNNFVELTEDEV